MSHGELVQLGCSHNSRVDRSIAHLLPVRIARSFDGKWLAGDSGPLSVCRALLCCLRNIRLSFNSSIHYTFIIRSVIGYMGHRETTLLKVMRKVVIFISTYFLSNRTREMWRI